MVADKLKSASQDFELTFKKAMCPAAKEPKVVGKKVRPNTDKMFFNMFVP